MIISRMKSLKYVSMASIGQNISYQGRHQHHQNNMEMDEKKPMLSFQDPKCMYKRKENWELARAYFVFSLCGIKIFMENHQKMMTIGKRVLGKNVFKR